MEIPKIPLKYNCELCDYHTSSKKDYDKHSSTDKHKGNKKVVKNPPKYNCDLCDYHSINKLHYNRHLLTGKHIKNTKSLDSKENITCDEMQSDHIEKVCNAILTKSNETRDELVNLILKSNESLMKSNENVIAAIRKHPINKTKITFNAYLNTTCKDAMNMSDFFKEIVIDASLIRDIIQYGQAGATARLINERLISMPMNKRPMHFTDSKREKLWGKQANEWHPPDTSSKLLYTELYNIERKEQNLLMDGIRAGHSRTHGSHECNQLTALSRKLDIPEPLPMMMSALCKIAPENRWNGD